MILDSGCTRAMGSRFAIDRLKPGNNIQSVTTFGFQNNHVQVNSHLQMENNPLLRRDVIHFRNDHAHTGWITTCVDTLDKGKVPILF